MKNRYIHYGCGLDAPEEWENFDVSMTLRLNRIPILNVLLKKIHYTNFPKNVKYGNIVDGLKGVEKGSCKAVFCSHVLEHLAMDEFNTALDNTYSYLQDGGIFRCVVPDLKFYILKYMSEIDNDKMAYEASSNFMHGTHLGYTTLGSSLKQKLMIFIGRSKHKWMWDEYSLKYRLLEAGFSKVRICNYGDSKDYLFNKVENKIRYGDAVAFECIK